MPSLVGIEGSLKIYEFDALNYDLSITMKFIAFPIPFLLVIRATSFLALE